MNVVPVVPVERLTSRGDLFRCEPYAAVITARACLGRQESARRAPGVGVPASAARNSKCEDCPLGARVADRLAAYPDDGSRPVVPTCTAPGCTRPVVGARASQRPLCPEHSKPQEPETMPAKKTDDAEAATTCAAKGCAAAPPSARSDTRSDLAPFCIEHRVAIRNRARAFPGGAEAVIAHLRAGTLPPPTPLNERARKPARAPSSSAPGDAAVAPSSSAPGDAAVVDYVTRSLRVVSLLGGIVRAEKIAETLGSEG